MNPEPNAAGGRGGRDDTAAIPVVVTSNAPSPTAADAAVIMIKAAAAACSATPDAVVATGVAPDASAAVDEAAPATAATIEAFLDGRRRHGNGGRAGCVSEPGPAEGEAVMAAANDHRKATMMVAIDSQKTAAMTMMAGFPPPVHRIPGHAGWNLATSVPHMQYQLHQQWIRQMETARHYQQPPPARHLDGRGRRGRWTGGDAARQDRGDSEHEAAAEEEEAAPAAPGEQKHRRQLAALKKAHGAELAALRNAHGTQMEEARRQLARHAATNEYLAQQVEALSRRPPLPPPPPVEALQAPPKQTDPWDARYDDLLQFRLEHGHCLVARNKPLLQVSVSRPVNRPRGRPAIVLPTPFVRGKFLISMTSGRGHKWVHNQRKHYRQIRRGQRSRILNPERIARLDRLGFAWNAVSEVAARAVQGTGGGEGAGPATPIMNYDQLWECQFQCLERYQAEHGHCRLHLKEEDKSLSRWVAKQRTKYHTVRPDGTRALRPERVERLEALGVDWITPGYGSVERRWDAFFEDLVAYRDAKGDCRVPFLYADNRSLGAWVTGQRVAYKDYRKHGRRPGSVFDAEKIRRLEDIGFEWVLVHRRWRKKPKDLEEGVDKETP